MTYARFSAWLVAACAALSLLTGCGGDVCEDDFCSSSTGSPTSSSSSTGGSCTDTTGALHGAVYQFAPPGDSNSKPAGNALIELRQMPGETPLTAMADAEGAYSVDLQPGTWTIGGTSDDGYCTPKMMGSATITECGDVEVDIVLDECVL